MVDGKFYDAGAYKASPVPFAIWGQTVYEAERTGVSQGLFTVGEVLQSGKNWIAEGKWRPVGSDLPKKHQDDAKPRMEEDEAPPKLRRPESEKPAPPAPASASPEAKAPPANPAPADTKPSSEPSAASKASEQPVPVPSSTESYNSAANDEDPNRPVLQRGKAHALGPAAGQASALKATAARPKAQSKTEKDKENASPQLIPAISDAGGPDPRPYSYDIKPDEEQNFRRKMLALATEAVLNRAKQVAPLASGADSAARPARSARGTAKSPQPTFEDVQFRAFDLWNTNEPVFVLTAKAQMPRSSPASTDIADNITYYVTLVDKVDIYGDLRKLNVTVTDTHHLDEIPRLELIDAVDADGDGRGELLFRQISDTGSTWAIYRAGADQLFPLFQGTL